MKKSQEHKPVSEKDRWWKICMIMKLTLFMCDISRGLDIGKWFFSTENYNAVGKHDN